jgi:hypothetical protein
LTGKQEKRANIMAIASNDFTVTTAEREEEDLEDEDAASPSSGERKKKRPAFDLALSNEKGGASFEKLTFTEKKLLLMADQERSWSMDRLFEDADFDTNTMIADFDNKTFSILGPEKGNFDIA